MQSNAIHDSLQGVADLISSDAWWFIIGGLVATIGVAYVINELTLGEPDSRDAPRHLTVEPGTESTPPVPTKPDAPFTATGLYDDEYWAPTSHTESETTS